MWSSACFLVPDWWVELLFNYLQSVFCAWHSSSYFPVFTIKWDKGIYFYNNLIWGNQFLLALLLLK